MAADRGLILAIDQGTTNSKVLLVDRAGRVVASASCPLAQSYPHPAWVEQSAAAIWTSVREAIDEVLAAVDTTSLIAVAITNQRESVTAWHRASGEPAGPVIVWQCRRTADFCETLRERGAGEMLARRTGLQIDPLFSASKMRWLLDNTPDGHASAERGELCLGTMDSWLLWNLSGGVLHATDLTNASRTQLLDIHERAWSDELLGLFGVPRAALPEVRASSGSFGATVAVGKLPAGVPIAAMIGDSHAALFGQAGFVPGAIKATYGTGSSLMTPVAAPVLSARGLSTTIAWALDSDQVTYALEGNISVSGAAVGWLAGFLGLEGPEAVAELARGAVDAGSIYMVPALVGLGAPHWDSAARGLISGLTFGSSLPQLARATIEAVCYQVRDVFDVMEAEAGAPLKMLLADGGAARNPLLMQFQSDIIGRPLQRSLSTDAAPLGAAYLAGLHIGRWGSLDEIAALERPREQYEPGISAAARARLYSGWQTAVARARLGGVDHS